MQRFLTGLFAALVAANVASAVRADDTDAKAIIDKAVKALGGEAKLAKLAAYAVKSKGTITINGAESMIATEATVAGIDRFRQEFEGEFNGNKVKGAVVLNGDKAWRKFGDNVTEINADGLVNEKRAVYLQVIPGTILPLRTKAFKVETTGEENVGGKQAAVLKVTGPEGKEFKLAFDKDSGLPVRLQARVPGFQGAEFNQETIYSDITDFDGIKRAKRIESTRDGQPFLKSEVLEFKAIEKIDAKAFDQPE